MEGLGLADLLTLRFYGAASNGIGELIRIKFISGDLIEGLFYSLDPADNKYFIITHPRRMSRSNKPLFFKENYLKVSFKDILYFSCEYKNLKPKTKHNLETDVDISMKKKLHSGAGAKGLVQFTLKENEELYQGNLNEDSNTKWNQFELNKEKYNVSTTYNENNYTTKLDSSLIPQEHKLKTEKIMKDILSVPNVKETNIHLLEERGLITGEDMDEEEKYSSVFRDINSINLNSNKDRDRDKDILK